MSEIAPDEKISKQVLCFGDSLTKGYYLRGYAYHPYSKVLGKRFPDFNFIEKGQDGDRVVAMILRLEKLLEKEKLDCLILLGGINDLGYGVPSEKIIEAFKSIYNLVENDSNIKQFYHLTIPYNKTDENKEYETLTDKKNQLNAFILNELNSSKRIVVDINDPTLNFNYLKLDSEKRNLYWDDPIHYSAEGYDILGKIIGDFLDSNWKTTNKPKSKWWQKLFKI